MQRPGECLALSPEEKDQVDGAPRGPEPPPRNVLTGVTRREPDALREFFEHYLDTVHSLAFRLVGESLAEDVTQDVFFKVHRAAHRLDPERDPRYWLNAITYNTCREIWRSGAHKLEARTVSIQDKPEVGARLRESGRDPEMEYEVSSREASVQAAIESLPEPLRAAIVLHDYQGLGHEAVAEMTGISHVAARKRYSRALAELAKKLRG